jgi:glycosyltransferase involved in cell wall biosynthesis
MTKRRLLSIIIPVFNEEKTVKKTLARVASLKMRGWNKEIIVINDGSNDQTGPRILEFRAKVNSLKIIRHRKNLGKGTAIKTGLKKAKGDAVIVQDADLEYNPSEIKKLLAKYSPNQVVFGSRNIQKTRQGYQAYVWGDKFLTFLVNLFFGTKLTDVFTCYKLLPSKIFKSIPIESRGFEFEMELTVKLLHQDVKINEVPISYIPRTYQEGKKFTFVRAIRDGCLSVWYLIKFASCKTVRPYGIK